MEKPELYQLTRIRWQFFGSLTFRAADVPERTRLSMWFSVARKCAGSFGLYFPTLPWCLRQEEGETNGRKHFHVLLGGLPSEGVTIQTCFALMSWWQRFLPQEFQPCKNGCKGEKYARVCPKCGQERKRFPLRENPAGVAGGGMARVRLFDPSLNGVDYVVKCLGMSGADVYESAKFGSKSSGLMVSKGVEKILGRVIREETRHIQRLEKRSENPPSAVQAAGGLAG